MTLLRRLGMFLYDFLVGEQWELFVGPIVALIVAWLAITAGVAAWLVGVGLFLAIVALAAISVFAGLRQAA